MDPELTGAAGSHLDFPGPASTIPLILTGARPASTFLPHFGDKKDSDWRVAGARMGHGGRSNIIQHFSLLSPRPLKGMV